MTLLIFYEFFKNVNRLKGHTVNVCDMYTDHEVISVIKIAKFGKDFN